MLGDEGREVRRDVLAAERGGRRDDQPARGALRAGRERVLRGAQLGKEPKAILVERRAFRRQRHLARRALEELDREALLELVDAPADHRRRDAFLARRGRKAAALRHFDEGCELLEAVHWLSGSINRG